ncbi:MAG TPA: 3D domain-containing protein [Kofleriaceae bacterium]|nr:3D domain-containing protein [Kofleriaceae bacterium]
MRWLVVALLIAGCREPAPRKLDPPPPPGAARGTFALTYYWMSTPTKPGIADTKLYAKDCSVLATVSAAYAKEMTETGNGRLVDGRTLVVAGECACSRSPCFRDETVNLWGTGAGGRALVPFRSMAVDRSVIPLGTRLWIEELDGVAFPGAPLALHDGCVIADDTGGKIKGDKLDFFVGDEASYRDLDRALKLESVTVHDAGARCP